jgi:hypothetical protein
LLVAAYNGHKDVVELLLNVSAEVNAKNAEEDTSLHAAAIKGNAEIAELLLANKAEVNARDKRGWTPLHLAAGNDHVQVVELLLAHKADAEAKSNDGLTPLQVAQSNGREKAVDALSPVVMVEPDTLREIRALGSDLVFYTAKDKPITRLSELTDLDTQLGVLEFSARMLRLRQLLSGRAASPGQEAQAGGVTTRALGETSMSGGGVMLKGIGEDGFGDLFYRHPRLRLFVTPKGAGGESPIEKTGGGLRVRLVAIGGHE